MAWEAHETEIHCTVQKECISGSEAIMSFPENEIIIAVRVSDPQKDGHFF